METALLERAAAPPPTPADRHPKPAHRADVQGLRALAVLLVVLYHADLGVSGGFVGVDVFFVISGFVITRALVWEQGEFGRIDLGRFFGRRVRRILPALSLTVSVTIIATVFLGPLSVFTDARDTAVAAVLVNANNELGGVVAGGADGSADYFTPTSELNPFLHTWSLSVEEQFYLVFPFLVAAAAWLGSRRDRSSGRAWIVGALLAVVAISFALSLAVIGSSPQLAFYLSPLRAWEFGVGALLIGIDRLGRTSAIAATAIGATGMALVTAAAFLYDEGTPFPGLSATVPVLGTALVLLAGALARNPITRLLSVRPAAFVGDISYSWYLWHWPMLVFAAATFRYSQSAVIGAVVASLAVAAASTVWFENPIRFTNRTTPETLRLAAACVVLPLAATLIASTLRPVLLTSEPIERFDEVFAAHAGQTETCTHVIATNPECTWEVEGAVGSALLIGDSNAHHFVEGFVAGMHEKSFDATLAYSPGCTFSALDMHAWGEARPHCADFHAAALRDLAGNPHDLVVVATAVDLYVEDDGVQLRASTAGEFESDAGVKARLLADAYAASFSELGALDVDVVFVRSVPQLGDWYPHECSAITWMSTESGCGISLSWAEVDAYSARGSAVESHALDVSGLRSVDFTEFLCGIDGCSAVVDGEWRWKDRGHLTVEQSLALSSSFAALVSR